MGTRYIDRNKWREQDFRYEVKQNPEGRKYMTIEHLPTGFGYGSWLWSRPDNEWSVGDIVYFAAANRDRLIQLWEAQGAKW